MTDTNETAVKKVSTFDISKLQPGEMKINQVVAKYK